MFAEPLFLDGTPLFGPTKEAGMLTRLGDNVDLWPQEILQEALRRHPYLSDFELQPVIDKLNEEQGYAFGSLVVRGRSDRTYQESLENPVAELHVPLVVKDQQLQPMDVFIDGGRYYHMTEARLRGALFQAETFDAARRAPPSPSLFNELMPPTDRNYGFGFGGKTAASILPLLPQLDGRVDGRHVHRVKEALANPAVMAKLANSNDGVRAAFLSACRLASSMSAEKTAELVWKSIRPNVVQLQKLASGRVRMKWANTDMYLPQEEEIAPEQAHELLGDPDLVAQLEADGSVTASPNAAVKQTLDAEEVVNVDQFGIWQVQDVMGNKLVGMAFPQLLSLDLQPMPLILFTNGSQYGLQERVAGKLIGKSTDIPRADIRGYGALFYTLDGAARAFVPMTVTSSFQGPEGAVHYMVSTDLGESLSFSFGEGLKTVAAVGPGEYVIPMHFKWLPLKAHVELVPDAMLFQKTANMSWKGTVEILGDGNGYSFRGGAVEKLASEQRSFLNRARAEFLACAIGMTPAFIKSALDMSRRGKLVTVTNVRGVEPAQEKVAASRAAIRQEFDSLAHPIRNYDLTKEAAFLDDAMTVDKVLGLGFITAENISTFVDMLPALEETSSRLAEMLVASRIGMKDVPEAAVERVLIAMEDVISGLRSLQQREREVVQ